MVACIECLISEFTEGNIFAVEIDVKYFSTAHLFIININSVFEAIIKVTVTYVSDVLSLAFILPLRV